MSEFKLTNNDIEDWEETQFLTYENNVATYLVVDWGTKEVSIENMPIDNIHRGYYVCDSTSIFELDFIIDFSKFEEFYNKAIKPLIIMMSEEIEKQWIDKENVLDIKADVTESNKLISALYDSIFGLLSASPKHNYYIAWSFDHITDFYEEEGGLITFLENNGLDFTHVNLTDEICKGAIGHIERDFVKVMMPFESFKRELKNYQASYQ